MVGPDASSGRGHVYYNGRPLCAEGDGGRETWDINASNVVCRMLGFSSATTTLSLDGCPYAACPAGIPYAYGGIQCTGSETHIIDCPRDQTVGSHCGSSGITNGNGASSDDIIGIQCGKGLLCFYTYYSNKVSPHSKSFSQILIQWSLQCSIVRCHRRWPGIQNLQWKKLF